MTINKELHNVIIERLKDAQRILVTTHIHPDGDAIGSLLGIGLALLNVGKEVQMVLDDGVPSNLKFLPGCEHILKRAKGSFDLVLVVDCSDLMRVGKALTGFQEPDINIDHHITNTNFAQINLVDTNVAATAEIIYDLISELQIPLTQPIANALMTGLITDSIGFRTTNVTPRTLRTAADILETGINMSDLYQRALMRRSFEAAHIWGFGLNKLERNGRLIWTTLSLADRESAGYAGRDDADLINFLTVIDGVDIALIFLEQKNGSVKVSWRAQPGYDVSKLATSFGGGGHPAASGAEIQGCLYDVQTCVLNMTLSLLEGGFDVSKR